VVFFNPASTNAALTGHRIATLRRIMPHCDIKTVETSPDGYQANRALVEKHAHELGEGSLLCIAGGDGTTNQIIEAILLSTKLTEAQRSTPILPLWCGNGNDLAHMLNGSNRTRLEDILTKGQIVAIHPLQCTINQEDGKSITRIAACYAGFGATAFAARRLNEPAHRRSKLHAFPGGRPLQEVITVAGALLEAPSFAVKDTDAVQIVYERTFANGSRMAKLMRLPVELTDEMFYINTLEHRKLVSALPHVVDLLLKRVSGKFLRNHMHFTTQGSSWAHFDGEPQEVPANTDVDVQLSPQPFYALSIILGNHKRRQPPA
jgi:hypothetical protein